MPKSTTKGAKPTGRRPFVHDTQTVERLILRLQAGATIKDACLSAGVGETSYFRAMEHGEADEENNKNTKYREFRQRALRARADARVTAVSTIRQAMNPFERRTRKTRSDGKVEETIETVMPDWRAAAWYLERSDPENWARRDKLEHTGEVRTDAPAVPTDEERLLEVAAILRDSGSLDLDPQEA